MIDDCDLAGMLEDMGVPVVVAGRKLWAIVRRNDVALEEDSQSTLVGKTVALTLRATDAAGVKTGDVVDVGDGKDYRVRRNLQENQLAKVFCVVAGA